jgi:hypothetical protein
VGKFVCGGGVGVDGVGIMVCIWTCVLVDKVVVGGLELAWGVVVLVVGGWLDMWSVVVVV